MPAATRAIRPSDMDVTVVWKDGYKPDAFPHTRGTLFMAKGQVAWVKWDGGDGRTIPVSRSALVVEK